MKKRGSYRYLAKGLYLTNTGYLQVAGWNNGRRGRVLEHRYIMEQHLGRKLRKGECIHHKNGIKTDNRIENLELCQSHALHVHRHLEGGTWNGGRPKKPRVSSSGDVVMFSKTISAPVPDDLAARVHAAAANRKQTTAAYVRDLLAVNHPQKPQP